MENQVESTEDRLLLLLLTTSLSQVAQKAKTRDIGQGSEEIPSASVQRGARIPMNKASNFNQARID